MKLLVLSCVVIGALAQLPRYRPAMFRFQRQELAPTTTDSPTEPSTEQSGPYPPSGWKPAGQPFSLPNEDKQPAEQYGPPDAPYPPSGWNPQGQAFELPKQLPATTYGVPDNTYGPPNSTPDSTDAPTTENPETDKLLGVADFLKNIESYFIVLPENVLKKLLVTDQNAQNVKMSDRLQLRSTSPALAFRP